MVERDGKVIGCGVILKNGNQILLGKRADGQGWCNAGGKLEEGETLKQCVIREALEEFGVEAYELQEVCCFNTDAMVHGKRRAVESHVFVSENFYMGTRMDDEITELKWFDLDTVLQEVNLFHPSKVALTFFKAQLEGRI